MCWRTCRRSGSAAAFVLAAAVTAAAQSVDPSALLKPPADSWPTYHGDYSGQHHSRLTQITPANVGQLTLAWAFQTGQTQQIKATPILVNGVIYVTTPDNLWAIDARSGRQIWRYTYPTNDGFHIGHRGAAVSKDLVYLTTPDAHLLALDARDGTVKWNVVIADAKKGYWSTNAPLLIRNHLIVGVSGDFDNLPGILRSFDADTGKPQWTFYSTPPPDTPGSVSGGATGGQMWMTGTYDPELNLLFVGTGNPTPVLNGEARPGDNRWTGSIVALNPDTGTMAWGFQASPHDTHDWDAAEVPVLVDAEFGGVHAEAAAAGVAQRLLLRARSHHRQEPADDAVCHRQLGERRGRGRTSDPQPGQGAGARRAARRARRGRRHQLPLAEFRPGHRAADRQRARRLRHLLLQEGARRATAGPAPTTPCTGRGVLRALDYRTGQVRWSHDLHGGAGAAGVLTTARRPHVHRRLGQQRDGAADERRLDAVAFGHRARGQCADHLRAGRAAVRVCSAAAARCTPSRSRCRDKEEHEPARPVDTRSMDGRPGAGGARAARPGPGGTGGAAGLARHGRRPKGRR